MDVAEYMHDEAKVAVLCSAQGYIAWLSCGLRKIKAAPSSPDVFLHFADLCAVRHGLLFRKLLDFSNARVTLFRNFFSFL